MDIFLVKNIARIVMFVKYTNMILSVLKYGWAIAKKFKLLQKKSGEPTNQISFSQLKTTTLTSEQPAVNMDESRGLVSLDFLKFWI